MRKYIFAILAVCVATASVTFSSCSKIPANEDLDGQWQLMEINLKEMASAPHYDSTIYKKEELIYWRFQLDLLMIRSRKDTLNGKTPETTARFKHTGKNLDITSTYIHFRDRDSLLTDPNTKALERIGITGNAEKFNVEKLDSKQMILTTDVKRLVFRKF